MRHLEEKSRSARARPATDADEGRTEQGLNEPGDIGISGFREPHAELVCRRWLETAPVHIMRHFLHERKEWADRHALNREPTIERAEAVLEEVMFGAGIAFRPPAPVDAACSSENNVSLRGLHGAACYRRRIRAAVTLRNLTRPRRNETHRFPSLRDREARAKRVLRVRYANG
jgi:hypothetical protein